ncbi:ComEC/Rec2 family competence protein [bacterium]|nr:ComEC/Rec2 family competence protein [bacterium]MBU1993856.1 ComEC/Rec2 family competence protein [bacterium]
MLKEVSLFNTKRDLLTFLLACGLILAYTLLMEFQNYKNLTRFNSALINATVLKQYEKTKGTKSYQVLQLKADKGFSFYTTANQDFPHAKEKRLELELFAEKVTFYEYFTGFYASCRVLNIDDTATLKHKLNSYVSQAHENQDVANIYQALYTATPLSRELQSIFSALGVSHLLAISGFHLGVLSALLFFLLQYPYKLLQDRYFPYRNSKSDLFIIVAIALLSYLLFLDSPPSLLRAFFMLVIGFVLYDRGIKIISMQTLFLTLILLLALFPRLVFSLGFWLSVSGVFYIFLFLIHFKHLGKIRQFILLPFWVYLLMLPFSLVIFGNFSIFHPLAILWTTLFTLFYPLSIFLHSIGFGNLFDGVLETFMRLAENKTTLYLSYNWLILHIALSLLSLYKKLGMWILLLYSFFILVHAIYDIT